MESLQALLQVRDVCRRGRERQRGSFIPPDSSQEKFSAGKPSGSFSTACHYFLASMVRQKPSRYWSRHHTLLVKSRHTCSRHVHSYMHMCICIHAQMERH